MTSNWNTPDGFYVVIQESKEILFPEKCVVCKKEVQDHYICITGNPVGYYGLWKYQLGFNPKIKVPAHTNCGKKVKSSIQSRNVILMGICGIVSAMGIYFDWERWQFILFFLVLGLPPICWQIKNAPPFEFELDHGVFEFHFSDKEYAEEFAKINGVTLSKMDL